MIDAIPWEWIREDEVYDLHRREMERAGVELGAPVAGCVERSIGASLSAALYSSPDGEPDLLVGTAYLLVYPSRNHCFTDGNKRVAWSAATHQLLLNRLRIIADQDVAADLVERASQGHLDAMSIAAWLAESGRVAEVSASL